MEYDSHGAKLMTEDFIDRVREKVQQIFVELVGDRAEHLDGCKISTRARSAIEKSLVADHGNENAEKIAMHMADWNDDAAFIVALHLFPERFTPEEIETGIGMFLIHAPNHIRAACELTDTYVWENFPDD